MTTSSWPERERSRLHVPNADEEHGAGAERDRQIHEDAEDALGERKPDPRSRALRPSGGRSAPPRVPPAERLDDAERVEDLLHDAERSALEAGGCDVVPSQPPVVRAAVEEEERRHHERDEAELPVDPDDRDEHRDEHDERADQRHEPVDRHVLERRRVALDPVDRVHRSRASRGTRARAAVSRRNSRSGRRASSAAPSSSTQRTGRAPEAGRGERSGLAAARSRPGARCPSSSRTRGRADRATGQRLRAEDAVDGELDRDRRQQDERRREQADARTPSVCGQ